MNNNSSPQRGIVICPTFATQNGNVTLSCDTSPEALRRYCLYWDRVGYAYPNGLGKPNFDALHDLRYLDELGMLSLYDVPVSTTDIGREDLPTPALLSEAPHLISRDSPTEENPSGYSILGTPASIWPELSTYAQLEAAASIAPKDNCIWTLGECNSELRTARYPTAQSYLLESTLYASLPVPVRDTPLEELIEFREERKLEILQLRDAIDSLRASVQNEPDSIDSMIRAKEKIEIALIQLQRTLQERGMRSFLSTLKMYLSVNESGIISALLATLSASAFGAELPLEVGAKVGLGVNTVMAFAESRFQDSRGLPAELSDFAYLYDINAEWPS